MARLGELERKVMDVLWAEYPSDMTGRDVEARLPGYAYTTILTILDRLEHKGLVARTRADRAHRYTASEPRESYIAELMHEALDVTSDRVAALVRFTETVNPKEASVLRSALDTGKKGRPR